MQAESKSSLAPLEKPSLTGWKSGLGYERKDSSQKSEGPSRYKKFHHRQKKGFFKTKVKGEDAPSLMHVVNAKPEIKQKATEQIAQRAKMKEEKRQKTKARIHVKKKPPMQTHRDKWTNVFSNDPTTLVSPAGRKSKFRAPPGYKPPPGSFKPDWTGAYQAVDMLSPTSGKPKMVAKQDLVFRDRIMSPKKKTHTNMSPTPLPSISLDDDDDDDDDDDAAESPGHYIKDNVEQMKKSSPQKPSLNIEDESFSSESSDDDEEEEEKENEDEGARPVTPPLDDEPQSKNQMENLGDYVADESTTEEVTPPPHEKPKMKKKLILEFALPDENGEDALEEGLQVPVDLESIGEISSVGSWPSIESQDSYDTKMNKMLQRWMETIGPEGLKEALLYSNDVDLEDNVLDHIALATPDLEEAMDIFEEMTGIRPTPVGPLQGLGARTAHIGLDNNRYLELLAPDLENPGPLGMELSQLEKGTITPYHYSIRSSEVSRLIEGYVYDVLGWDPDHIAMVQALPDNSTRQWDMLTMYGHDVGGVAPCYVNWKDPAQHPTSSIALKATLLSCTVQAPKDHDVHKLITGVEGLDVKYGSPLLEVKVSTPNGELAFSAKNPKGLVFPGYDDGQQHISQMMDMDKKSGDRTIDEDYLDIGSDSHSTLTPAQKR